MIDLRTLLAMTVVADVLLAATLWLAAPRRPRADLLLWIGSLVAQASAFALFAFSSAAQQAVFVLAATLFAISLTLQAAALLCYDRRELPVWVHTAVLAGVAPPLALTAGDIGLSILFGGVVFGTLVLLLAAIAWQLRPPASKAARSIIGASAVLLGASFLARGISAAWSVDPMQGFVAPTPLESAMYLGAYATILGTTFGFLLLQKERADVIARHASVDMSSGTYNRHTFDHIAAREFSRVRRSGQPLSLILLDIDHFPEVAARGHRFTEHVLRRFVEIVRAALRKEDLLVRFEGGQFLVMLPDVPGPGAVIVAGRIRREVEEENFAIDGQRVPVTVSAGVAARLDEGPESVDSLLGRAEQALALAHRRGRNRVVALSLGRSIAA